MKQRLGFICISIILIFVTIAFSQDDEIKIKSEELGRHKRSLVVFPHLKHEEAIECSRCHHDYDEYGANLGEDGQACSECHKSRPLTNPVPLMKAFHLQCKACHTEMKAKGKENVPVMCGQCHVR